MSHRIVLRVTVRKSEALTVGVMAVFSVLTVIRLGYTVPIRAQAQSASQSAIAATPRFEIASVKPRAECVGGGPRLGISASPGRLSIQCQTVDFLIRQAYLANGRDPLFVSARLYNQQIQGSPAWISSEHYAIDANVESPQTRETMLGRMMQTLLEDRFNLKIRRETREIAVYELTVTKGGDKLQAARERSCAPFDADQAGTPPGKHSCGVLIRSLAPDLSQQCYTGRQWRISAGASRAYWVAK